MRHHATLHVAICWRPSSPTAYRFHFRPRWKDKLKNWFRAGLYHHVWSSINITKCIFRKPQHQPQQSCFSPCSGLDIGSLVVYMFASWNFRKNTVTKTQTGYTMTKPMIPAGAWKVRPLRGQHGPCVVTYTGDVWNIMVSVKVQTEWKKNCLGSSLFKKMGEIPWFFFSATWTMAWCYLILKKRGSCPIMWNRITSSFKIGLKIARGEHETPARTLGKTDATSMAWKTLWHGLFHSQVTIW